MGNIIQQCPSQGKEKCKYITKYVFFFLFQALLIVCGVIILVSGLTPTCQHSNPNTCGCNLISSLNSGISVPCQTTGTYVPFNDLCYVNNQYYCCDSCSLSLGVCIVCTDQVTMTSNMWAGIGSLIGEVIMILITVWLIKRTSSKNRNR